MSQQAITAVTLSTTVSTKASQALERLNSMLIGGEARMGAARGRRRPRQTRLKTNVPLVPPKPKLFFTACSIFISRASLAQ